MSPARFDKSRSAVDRRWPALLLVCLLALSYVVTGQFQRTEPEAGVETDYRAPVANPVLEPDRPDLIGEPRIDEP
mgnify:CR=1 FL=1|jgi:hypothetical protein